MPTDLKSAWPQGDGIIIVNSGQVNIEASKTNHVWDVMVIPFSFVVKRVEIISQTVTIGNSITIDVADDASTPNVIVNDEALAAITAGAATAASIINAAIDDTDDIIASDALIFRYTSNGSDTSVGTRVRLWIRPVNLS